MSAVWMWVRSEWRREWGALLALGLLIAVAGGVTLAVAAGARRADTAMDRFMAATNQPQLEAELSFPENLAEAESKLDELPTAPELADRLAAVDGVDGVTVINWIAAAAGPDGEFFNGGFGAQRGRAPSMLVVDGRWADPADPHEVMVAEAAVEAWEAGVGETITLHTLGPGQFRMFAGLEGGEPEGPVVDVRVVGVIRDIEEISDAPEPFLITTQAFVERYSGEVLTAPGAASIRTEPGRIDEVAAAVQEAAGENFAVSAQLEDFAGRIDESVSVEVTALWAFALAAAAAGLTILYQAMSRHAAQLADDRFVRQTLGFTRRDHVAGSVLRLAPALVVGVAGAVGLAVALSPLFPRGLARRADPTLGVLVDGPVLLLGALAIVAVAVVVAVATSWRSDRCSTGRAAATPAPLGRLAGSLPPAADLGVRFALAPSGRLAHAGWAGVTGAAIAVAGLLAVAAVDQSADRLMSTPRLYGAGWDAILEVDPDEDADELVDLVTSDPDVVAVGRSEMLMSDPEVAATGPGGAGPVEPEVFHAVTGALAPTVTEGRLPSGSSEVAIGDAVADLLGADVGDAIEVDGHGGPVEMIVVGRVITAGNDELTSGFVVTRDGLLDMTADCAAASNDPRCSITTLGIGVVLRPGADRSAALARLSEIGGGFVPTPMPSVINNLGQIGSTPWYLAGFLALLGLAGLAHALTIGSGRRDRHLAVTRALGLRPRQAAATVGWQALTVAAAGAVIGMVLGVVAGRVVWRRVAEGTGALVETVVPGWVWVAAPAAVLVLAVLVGIVPAARAATMRPAELLRTE